MFSKTLGKVFIFLVFQNRNKQKKIISWLAKSKLAPIPAKKKGKYCQNIAKGTLD